MAQPNCKITAGVNWDSMDVNTWKHYGGSGAFVTTGTSVVVYIPKDALYLRNVQCNYVAAAGAAVANGPPTIGGVTQNDDGTLTPTTPGQITIYRAAGTDSALAFCLDMLWR